MNGFLSVSAAVAGFAGALFLLERLFPLRRPTRPLAGRLLVNGVYAALAFATVSLTVRPVAETMIEWTGATPFGLLHLSWIPGPVRPVLAFLLMDLTFYEWHRANHRIPFLWRFHSVHHVDPDLDVSTAFRFHFGELGLSSVFRLAQIGLIGPSLFAYAAYELAFQANTLFHHSNLRLPISLERSLNCLLVTPRMHGIHHSQVWKETNANYSKLRGRSYRGGFTVNAVSPGYINTEMFAGVAEEVKQKIIAQIPVGYLGEPDDVAPWVVMLASDEARLATGSTIFFNGGQYVI